jgi:hypothetical protein
VNPAASTKEPSKNKKQRGNARIFSSKQKMNIGLKKCKGK